MSAEPSPEVKANLDHLPHRPIAIDKVARSDGGSLNGFSSHRFDDADIVNLRRLGGGPSADVAELFRVIGHLNRRPVGAFTNFAQLHAGIGDRTASGPSSRAIGLLRDLFLDRVNKRLQDVYRKHFQAHPPPPRARHDEKVASLEATRAEAQAIVDSYDWHWLADWLQLERIGENAGSCVRRLSNFAFPVRGVNSRFTYHCNIACRHCYNSSGPHLKVQRIPLEPMLAIIAQMPDVGIGHLNLTGGEPFLYPDHLTALIAAGRTAGLRGINICTNGYWALSAERARKMLERLSAAGFMQGSADRLQVSTGAYHQEFIEFDRILTLARSFYAMFERRIRIEFEVAPGATVAESVRQQVCDAGVADQIDLLFRHVSPLGRARELNGIDTRSIDTPCNAINEIVFDPDGNVRPCCGFNNENHGVVIGQLKTHRLRDLVKRMENDPILQFLAVNPMSSIYEHIARPKSANGYSGLCHLCQDALGGMTDKEPLQAELFDRQQFYPFWFTLPGQEEAGMFQEDEPSNELG